MPVPYKTLFKINPLSAIIESPSSTRSKRPDNIVILTSDIDPVNKERHWDAILTSPSLCVQTLIGQLACCPKCK